MTTGICCDRVRRRRRGELSELSFDCRSPRKRIRSAASWLPTPIVSISVDEAALPLLRRDFRRPEPNGRRLGELCRHLAERDGAFYTHKRVDLEPRHTKLMLVHLLERALEHGEAHRLTGQDNAVIDRITCRLHMTGLAHQRQAQLLDRLRDPSGLGAKTVHRLAELSKAFDEVGHVTRNHKLSDLACFSVAAATRSALHALPAESIHAVSLRQAFLMLAKALRGGDVRCGDLDAALGLGSTKAAFTSLVRSLSTSPRNLRFGDGRLNCSIQERLDGSLRSRGDSYTPHSSEIQMALIYLIKASEACTSGPGHAEAALLREVAMAAASSAGSSSMSGPTPNSSLRSSPMKEKENVPLSDLGGRGFLTVPQLDEKSLTYRQT